MTAERGELFGKGDWISPERIAQAGIHWGELARHNAFDRSVQIDSVTLLRLRHPVRLNDSTGSRR